MKMKLFVLWFCFAVQLFGQGASKALSFDGSNDYVEVPDQTALNPSTFTLEAWIKTSQTTIGRILAKESTTNGDQRYSLNINITDNKSEIRFDASDDSGPVTATSTTSVNDNAWHHIAGVFDDSNDKLMIYVDGILEATTNTAKTPKLSSNPLYIGRFDEQYGNYFDGIIDEVRIWNTARTQAQIRDNMCRKLTGSESGLVAYWRMDDGSGQTVDDLTSNNIDGTLGSTVNSDDADPVWVTSGAAIGDTSAYDYDGTNPGDFSVNLAHTDGDDITATGDGGTVTGIQVYRVDEAPNVNTPPSGYARIDALRYWGVHIVGSSSPTYTVTYNYAGHPGISDESTLKMAYRADNSASAWTDLAATLNTTDNTLIKTGQSGTEYILGTTSADNSLPVELTSFTIEQEGGSIVLNWVTESEIENLGFLLERRTEETEWKEIASYITDLELQGQGSVTDRTEYRFVDNFVQPGTTYQYRLADVSYDGVVKYHGTREITVSSFDKPVLPIDFALEPVYPNPFNPVAHISYRLDTETDISLLITDIKGNAVRQLICEKKQPAGNYSVNWDGKNDNGVKLPSGVYFIIMRVNAKTTSQKIMLLR